MGELIKGDMEDMEDMAGMVEGMVEGIVEGMVEGMVEGVVADIMEVTEEGTEGIAVDIGEVTEGTVEVIMATGTKHQRPRSSLGEGVLGRWQGVSPYMLS